ncbi:MAG TPA: hypothetical protein VFO45_01885 [Sphingomicrobium sp.]|nr:hypothetical protein [Sphingomicrobium sp.]
MDVATHAITLISIIIGLGLTEMFGKLYRLIRNRRRVRWDFLPLAWVVTLFLLVLNFWWFLFLRLDASSQTGTVADFGLILLPSILLFVATASVLPDFSGDEEWDMRRDYDEQRKVFILTFALYQVSTFTTMLVVGRMDWDFLSVVRIAILAVLVSMLLTNSRRWDWIAVGAIMIALLIRLTTQVVR